MTENLLGKSQSRMTAQERVQLACFALVAWEQAPLPQLVDQVNQTDLRFLAMEVSHLLDLPVDVVAAAMHNLIDEHKL